MYDRKLGDLNFWEGVFFTNILKSIPPKVVNKLKTLELLYIFNLWEGVFFANILKSIIPSKVLKKLIILELFYLFNLGAYLYHTKILTLQFLR